MHILIPEYTFPTDIVSTQNAVAYLAYHGADVWGFSSGRITVWVFRSLEIANVTPYKPPSEIIEIQPGEIFVHAVEAVEGREAIIGDPNAVPPIMAFPAVEAVEAVAEVRMLTIPEIDAAAHALRMSLPHLTPMQLLGTVIYTHLLNYPRFHGSSLVP